MMRVCGGGRAGAAEGGAGVCKERPLRASRAGDELRDVPVGAFPCPTP